jgi:ABC-2 type transport system ATP-binding protein
MTEVIMKKDNNIEIKKVHNTKINGKLSKFYKYKVKYIMNKTETSIKKAISIKGVGKIHKNGFQALNNVNLEVAQGEIFALLGPNGAGKTTLISTICGIVNASSGSIEIFGDNNVTEYRAARSHIGLVPQELTTDSFETVWNTVSFSRGLFGKSPSPAYIEDILKNLSLWDKRNLQIRMLSGGMKRRVLIAKALSHEPDILFLDEPSSGVDVDLRKSMWQHVRKLQETGTTIFLTTHYIHEAEEMADRIGIINKGELVLIKEKKALMKKLGKKKLVIDLYTPLTKIPESLLKFNLHLAEKDRQLIFTYDPVEDNNIANFLNCLKTSKIHYKDLDTHQSSLEEIFIELVNA